MAGPALLEVLCRVPLAAPGSEEQGWLAVYWPHLVGGVLIAAGLVAAVVFSRYLRISLRLFLNTQMPMTAGLGAADKLGGERHEFPSRDGTSLVGEFIDLPAGVPCRGTVIFAHEYRGDRRGAERYTAGLPEMGFRVFTFDFRGHGASSGTGTYQPSHWVTDREVDDLLGAVAYVEATAGEMNHPIGVAGVSRGACAAAIASLSTRNIRALVVDGLFSTDLMVEGLMNRWAAIFAAINLAPADHSDRAVGLLRVFTILYAELTTRNRYPLVRKALTRLDDVPMLFIYGEDDTYIEKEHRIRLYRHKPGPKELWEVPGAKHNQAVVAEAEAYRRRLTEFFEKHLASSGKEPHVGG